MLRQRARRDVDPESCGRPLLPHIVAGCFQPRMNAPAVHNVLNHRHDHNMILRSVLVLLLSALWRICDGAREPFGYMFNDQIMPLVRTHSGDVRGFREHVLGRTVQTFLGIPFAEPPVGELRFRKPVPIKPWMRELKAMFLPPSCAQPAVYVNRVYNFTGDERSEDCLYLNVWTSSLDIRKPMPVMVFLYGGAFFFGSTNYRFYNGAYLAALADVVVVSVQYRLGPFGFLEGRHPEIPGNQGLWDQNLGFQWVKRNIHFFGGDANAMTLFGHSAGAISTGFHLVSPLSRGLFNRVIMQSGSPYFRQSDDHDAGLKQFYHLATELNCGVNATVIQQEMPYVIECLREKNYTEIIGAMENIDGRYRTSFYPNWGDDIYPVEVEEALNGGGYVNDLDLLIGATKDEGSLFIQYYLSSLLDFSHPELISKHSIAVYLMILFRFIRLPNVKEVSDEYISKAPDDPHEFLQAASHSLGDFAFVCPIVEFAEDYARRNNRVYFYEFTHRPSYSWNHEWQGIAHFDEIPFVFGTNMNGEFNLTETERAFTVFMMYTWTNFAKTGKMPTIFGKEWPLFDEKERAYVELNGLNTQIKNKYMQERCKFWANRRFQPRLATLKNTNSTQSNFS